MFQGSKCFIDSNYIYIFNYIKFDLLHNKTEVDLAELKD